MSKSFLPFLLALLLGVVACDDTKHEVADSGQDSGPEDAGVDASDPCIGDNGCVLCKADGQNLTFLNQCGDPRVQCQAYDGVIPPPPP